jgi:VanZ family protein
MMTDRRGFFYFRFGVTGLLQNRSALSLTCVLVVTAIIIVGLWPFNFFPSNGTNWVGKEKGLRFSHFGIAYSKDSLFLSPLSSTIEAFHPISIEILLKPYEETDGYIACIAVLSHNLLEAPSLTVGQWRSFFLIRTPRQANPATEEFDEIGVKDALRTGQQRFLTFTAGRTGAIIYVDGAKAKDFPSHRLLPDQNQETSFRVVLGNDIAGKSPWHGEVLGLAIYERELTPNEVCLHYAHWRAGNYSGLTEERGVVGVYTFDERSGPSVHNRVANSGHLRIPERFRALKPTVLAAPGRGIRLKLPFVQDVVVNILGFVPLGYLLMGCLLSLPGGSNLRRRWMGWVVVALGAGLSLLIEVLQMYLPTRDSSLMDVISNTTGTALGVLLFRLMSDRWVTAPDETNG